MSHLIHSWIFCDGEKALIHGFFASFCLIHGSYLSLNVDLCICRIVVSLIYEFNAFSVVSDTESKFDASWMHSYARAQNSRIVTDIVRIYLSPCIVMHCVSLLVLDRFAFAEAFTRCVRALPATALSAYIEEARFGYDTHSSIGLE